MHETPELLAKMGFPGKKKKVPRQRSFKSPRQDLMYRWRLGLLQHKAHAYRSSTDLHCVPGPSDRGRSARPASRERRAGGVLAQGFSFLTHSFSDSQVPEVVHRDARRKGGARKTAPVGCGPAPEGRGSSAGKGAQAGGAGSGRALGSGGRGCLRRK